MNKLTVIIPCYNVEKYISDCIRSLLNQTNQNFDVIFIEDCSTDDTLNVLKKYLSSNKILFNYRIHENKQNKGLSVSRNIGIELCNTEYLVFFDSDDLYKPNFIELILSVITANKLDMLNFGIELFNDGEEPKLVNERNKNLTQINTKDTLLKFFLNQQIKIQAVSKVFRSQIFHDKKIRFPENKFFEDIYVNVLFILNSENISVLNDTKLYLYRQNRKGSIMNTLTKKHVIDDLAQIDFLEHSLPEVIKVSSEYLNDKLKNSIDVMLKISHLSIVNNDFSTDMIELYNRSLNYLRFFYNRSNKSLTTINKYRYKVYNSNLIQTCKDLKRRAKTNILINNTEKKLIFLLKK